VQQAGNKREFNINLDKVNLVLRESLTGIRVIRAFNRLDIEKKRFYEANLDLTDTSIRVNKIMAAMQIMFSLIMVSIMYVMVPRAQASAARINVHY